MIRPKGTSDFIISQTLHKLKKSRHLSARVSFSRVLTWLHASAVFPVRVLRFWAGCRDCCSPLPSLPPLRQEATNCSCRSGRSDPDGFWPRAGCAHWRECGTGWVGQIRPNVRSSESVLRLSDKPKIIIFETLVKKDRKMFAVKRCYEALILKKLREKNNPVDSWPCHGLNKILVLNQLGSLVTVFCKEPACFSWNIVLNSFFVQWLHKTQFGLFV